MTSHEDVRSLATEDDYSIISREVGNSMMADKTDTFMPSGLDTENDPTHLLTSHQALATAYDHMKRRLSEVELINRSLQKRLARSNASEQSLVSSSVSNDCDITKAWEAYRVKCKESERLRDGLRLAEQRLMKSQNAPKGLVPKEELLQAKSSNETLMKRIQQVELASRDLQDKECLAREELLKEKEYHKKVMESAEERVQGSERVVNELQKELKEKNLQIQAVLKEQETLKISMKLELEQIETKYKETIRSLQGKLIDEQTERARLQSLLSTGGVDGPSIDDQSELDALTSELRSLTDEIHLLKRQASHHSMLLSSITSTTNGDVIDGDIIDDDIRHDDTLVDDIMIPVQCTALSIDSREVLKQSMTSRSMTSRSMTSRPMTSRPMTSRQMTSQHTRHNNNSQRMDGLHTLEHIKLGRSGEFSQMSDPDTSYYSAVPDDRVAAGASDSDNSNHSNQPTLTEGISPTPDLCYPPSGNTHMTPVWPTPPQPAVLWPPSTSEDSFIVLNRGIMTQEQVTKDPNDRIETSQSINDVTENNNGNNGYCPVCNDAFPLSASESFMTSHINRHFSQEDNDATIQPMTSR